MNNPKLTFNKDDDENHIDFLYKYVSEDRYSILSNGLIRYTQPQAFNDPLELKPFIKSLTNKSGIEKDLEKVIEEVIRENFKNQPETKEKEIIIQKLIETALQDKNKSKVLAEVHQGMQMLTPDIQKGIRHTFENHIGILSLTENDHNLLMWAHYANSHQGFVIGFDRNHKFFDQRKSPEDELRHLKKVDYLKQRPEIELATNASIDTFIVKSEEWAYEKEWRMLSMLKESYTTISAIPYDIHLFKIPFSAMTSVTVGARASIETKEKVIDLIRSNPDLVHMNFYSMNIHESKFKLTKIEEKL